MENYLSPLDALDRGHDRDLSSIQGADQPDVENRNPLFTQEPRVQATFGRGHPVLGQVADR